MPNTCGSSLKGALKVLTTTLLPQATPYSGLFLCLFGFLSGEWVYKLFKAELVTCYVILQLVTNIFPYCSFVFTYCIYIIFSTPEVPIPVFIF